MDFENLSFAEKLDIKNLRDDVYALSNVLPDKFQGRRLNHIILMNDSIREYITNFKLNTAEFHNSLIDILRRFKKFTNSSSEDFITLLSEYEDFAKKFNEGFQKNQNCFVDYSFKMMPLISNTILSLIGNVKDCVHRCDRLYDCAQTAYKVEAQSEPKYTKATAETIVKTFLSGDQQYCYNESNNDKLDLSDNKIVCKNIKAVKNDMISIVNKYFGKNSEFGALDIMNKII